MFKLFKWLLLIVLIFSALLGLSFYVSNQRTKDFYATWNQTCQAYLKKDKTIDTIIAEQSLIKLDQTRHNEFMFLEKSDSWLFPDREGQLLALSINHGTPQCALASTKLNTGLVRGYLQNLLRGRKSEQIKVYKISEKDDYFQNRRVNKSMYLVAPQGAPVGLGYELLLSRELDTGVRAKLSIAILPVPGTTGSLFKELE